MSERLRERIQELEEELRTTKYNKRTQFAVGLLKAKIARLKSELEVKQSKKTLTLGFAIKKTGDATVAIIGFPSAGKSTLLNKLTNAESKVGQYEFTTLTVVPGLLEYDQIQVQLLDVPGIIAGAAEGKGRGKEVLASIKAADLILILIDAAKPEQLEKILNELYDAKIRINKQKPDVKIVKKVSNGINISSVKLTKIDNETIIKILREFKINNADVVIREDIDVDELIDVIEDNRSYMPALIIFNKTDLLNKEQLEQIKRLFNPDLLISAEMNLNLNELKKKIISKLNVIRVYCKRIGKEPDLKKPLVLKKNSTLMDVCLKLHKQFLEKFKFARVWGSSVKFGGQRVLNLKHKLNDKDIVEIHLN